MVDMFTPGNIGGLELPNRILRSATWEALAEDDGKVGDLLIERIVELARGEVGLIILGITAISPEGRGLKNMTGIHSDAHVEGHRRLTAAVHEAGGRISIQLAHTGAQSRAKDLGGLLPVGPSAIHHPAFDVTPRELSTSEVKELIAGFESAAARAVKAGYDAIQLHAAHGYLIDQFMSPRFNRRDDEYGDPARFVMEVYEAVRSVAGATPIFAKLNLDDFLEGSTTPEVSLPIARKLSAAGIAAIEVSGGTPASGRQGASRTGIKGVDDEGYFLELARLVKPEVSCPVIGVGGYRSPEVINRVLAAGDVDFISMARPFLREPGLVKRWREGDLSLARCISCSRCFSTTVLGEGIQCYRELKEKGRME